MVNITIPSGLFQLTSSVNNKDYQNQLLQLRNISKLLDETEVEKSFISHYLSQKLTEKQKISNNNQIVLTQKEIEKYSSYASEGLRCNILSRILNLSVRKLSVIITMSPDYMHFIYNGRHSNKVLSKTRINNFQQMVSGSILKDISSKFVQTLSDTTVSEKVHIQKPVTTDIIWSDSTCLMSKIHFPVDWLLLKDIVVSLMTTIETLRNHGLKNRLPKSPKEFINEINGLSMDMTLTRRVLDGRKKRKKVFRMIKQLCKIVIKHGYLYRNILEKEYAVITDLSEAQTAQFIQRLDTILNQSFKAIKIAHSRIITGVKIAQKDKILSLYDDNASLIVRGKSGAEVEFGNELLISEQEHGLITSWTLYREKTSDTTKFNDIVDDMTSNGYNMKTLVTDRGFGSKRNDKRLDNEGIYNCMLPKNKELMTKYMKDENYKTLQKRRAQTESRIAILKQFTGNKLRQRLFEYKQMHVGWAVLAQNFIVASKLMNVPEAENELLKLVC